MHSKNLNIGNPGGGSVTPADPSTVTINATGGTFIADGKEHKVVATLSNGDGYTLEYSIDGGTTWVTTAPGLTEPGKLTVSVRATSTAGIATTGDVVLHVLESVPAGTKVKIVKHGTTTKAPFRSAPSSSAAKVNNLSLPVGTECYYQGKSGDWYKVTYNDLEGYIYYWFVDLQKIELKPTISSQPKDVTAAKDADATFKVVAKASEGTLTYQWQENGSNVSGATYASYTVKAEDTKDGYTYRCIVKDSNGSVTSREATLTVITTKPAFTKDLPATTGIVSGKTMTLSIAVDYADSYQWYYQEPGTSVWINAEGTGCHTPNYSAKATTDLEGYKFKCKATNPIGSTESKETELVVVTAVPKITTQPKSVKVDDGDNVTLSVVATGKGLTYQWYYCKPGGSFKKSGMSGADTDTIDLGSVPYSHKGYKYRCVVKNAKGKVTSKSATVTVRPPKPTITTQPSDLNPTFNVGDPMTFSIVASGTGLKYQWQYKTPSGSWKSCKNSSAKTDTYTNTAKDTFNGNQYRCKVTNKQGGVIYCDTINVTVN